MTDALLNEDVRRYWEGGVCGTSRAVTGDAPPLSKEWFQRVEEHRYRTEPCIREVAEFEKARGKALLEIGVGAGTDHVQWARAGAACHGVDLTQAAVDTAKAHLALHGLTSDLRRIDAEVLPFPDASFDVVWSWGVIHHAEHPDRVLAEVHRVLRPGGEFRGMFYNRRSAAAVHLWYEYALRRARPFQSLARVIANNVESPGTKAYTPRELRALFGAFRDVDVRAVSTPYDTDEWWPGKLFPRSWGWFLTVRAVRP